MNAKDMDEIKNIKSTEIHNIIGTFLQDNLKGFKFNRRLKQLERKNEIKTDVVYWNLRKYQNNTLLILSFTLMIRHNNIDTLYEKLFEEKPFSSYSIYNWILETSENGKYKHYHIHTRDELLNVLNEVLEYFKNIGMDFYNEFKSDNDFFEYLCVKKNFGIDYKNPGFSLRRIMYCHLLNKTEVIQEIKDFNIKCFAAENDNFHINQYMEKLNILEKYYNKK